MGLGLAFAGLIGLTSWLSWDAREAAWQHAIQTSDNLLSALEDDITRNIDSYDLSLQAVVDGLKEEELKSVSPRLRDMVLFDRAATAQFLGAMLVVDETGRVVIDSKRPLPPQQNVGDREYFLAHRDRRDVGLFISHPYLSRLDNAWEIGLSRRLEHPDGSFAGVVVGTLQVDFFRQLYDRVDTGAEGTIAFLMSDGTVITRKPYKDQDVGRSIRESVLFDLYPTKKAGIFELTSLLDGIPRLYVYRQIGDLPMIMSVGVAKSVIFAEWSQKTIIVALVTIGLAAVAALLGALCVGELRRRSRAEREAAANAAQYKLLADNSTDVIVRLGFDGLRKYVSPSAHDVLGYAPEQLIGRDGGELAHPDDRSLIVAARECMRQGEAEQTVTYRTQHADGRYIWAETKLRTVRDPKTGEPTELVAVLRDISARKGIEAQLIDAVEEAERAALVKSQFLATMSHEIRTPLNGVIGFADLLQRTELTATQRQYVELQRDAGRALLTIINDILDFSKLDAGKVTISPAAVDLPNLIDSCIQWFMESAEKKGLGLTASVEPALPRWVNADGPRLQQVLCNLLSNAIKFTRSGEVTVKAVLVGGQAPLLAVSVSDTGIGMPEGKLGLLFQRFSQLDGSIAREFGGTGLGLAISQRLVELMGGRIAVQSAVDHGSTFTVTLPLELAAAPAGMASATGEPAEARGATVRVLVAEDNIVNQKLIRAILKDAGYAVDIVGNGRDAIEAVKGQDYHLLLMDVQMPIMDGWQAAREIRRLNGAAGQIPMIALTAHVLAEDVVRCAEAGMQGYVAKPIRRDELVSAIEVATRKNKKAHEAA